MRSIASAPFVRILCGILLAGIAERATAVDSAYATVGGDRHITIYGAGLSWAPWWTLPMGPDWIVSLRGAAGVAYWDAHEGGIGGVNKSLMAVGAYPVLRLAMTTVAGVVPYVEGSIGVNVLSHTWIENRRLSTAFQFGEFVGIGAAFGDKHQFDIAARYQHISNADIKEPNDGLSYASIVFQYRFGSR